MSIADFLSFIVFLISNIIFIFFLFFSYLSFSFSILLISVDTFYLQKRLFGILLPIQLSSKVVPQFGDVTCLRPHKMTFQRPNRKNISPTSFSRILMSICIGLGGGGRGWLLYMQDYAGQTRRMRAKNPQRISSEVRLLYFLLHRRLHWQSERKGGICSGSRSEFCRRTCWTQISNQPSTHTYTYAVHSWPSFKFKKAITTG